MSDVSQRQCPICASTRVRLYCKRESADYYMCSSCGVIYQSPLPSQASMIGYVEEEYQAGKYRDYVSSRSMKLQHFEARLRQLGDDVRPGRLLDVGCSCGYFLEVAASAGFEVHGVEFSRSAIRAAAPSIQSRIVEGTLAHVANQGPFNVISAFDLVEHVPDPRGFLQQCRALLAPGGTLVISTPDTDHVLRPLMRARWPMLQPMQHLHLFSRRALRQVLEASGFADVRVETAYKVLSADYLINQVKVLNPVLSRILRVFTTPFPSSVLVRPRHVNIGEILAIAHVPPTSSHA
jgi:SAM-dependent methyltransferase